ncbi:WD40 repeat-like protein [Pleomassaria siparia CBS 279.74]|uniref:WD40 repeat-like protein n=1 Tax=Pleomassaria siparia CBS 279.74 TaxID=1314801 RepID=A0A6G1JYL9_9PLEO|nr:WD40 repeat-like protein [Pleomassaria siparia CBS 279.74]
MDFETTIYEEHLSVQNKETFMGITAFFQHFVAPLQAGLCSGLDNIQVPDTISRDELQGDSYDFQGIDWASRNWSRATVRSKRETFERTRMQPKLRQVREWHVPTPNTENYFSFRRMNTAHKPYIPHFQLRNLLAATSRSDVYYAAKNKVMHTGASGSPATAIMDLSKQVTDGQRFQVTTLAAMDDVLMAGGFEGEYALTSLSSTYGSPLTLGRIRDRSPDSKSHITNHIHLFESRHNYTPQAVLCSNDYRLRVLDCATNTFTHSFVYPTAVNCSATSPDGRMRVVVGDFQETLITNAETGKPFESLNSHTDDAFACAWADDGIHVATAAQDSTIVVWDARYWGKPLSVLYSELSVPRVLRFSPVGGGPRVLVAAEADDYVSIINAQTFESRQVFDFFGSTAGISMTPDGQSLFVANSERKFAGIMELERAAWSQQRGSKRWRDASEKDTMVDWADEEHMRTDHRVVCGWDERARRGVGLDELIV